MDEIFNDISEETRKNINVLFQLLNNVHSLTAAQNLLSTYRKLLNSREQEYMDFTFQLWCEEQRKNENNND